MPEITRIICPVDFSEPSARAVQHAQAIASWWRAELIVLHVYVPVPEVVPTVEVATVGGAGYSEPDLEPIERVAADFARRAGAHAETSRVLVRVGWPADEIVRHAGAGSDRMIVMGTHGTRGFRRMVIGSVAEKVVRTALCPVITVPPQALAPSEPPFRSILCPVDFTYASEHVVPLAVAFAREGDARLTLLYVSQVEAPEQPSMSGTFASAGRVSDEEADGRLRALLPLDAAEWCTPAVHLMRGPAGAAILKYAADAQSDLIVMGVRRRSGLDQAVFGSTTNQVLRGAPCPVMTERA